jgi:hypothetical protein
VGKRASTGVVARVTCSACGATTQGPVGKRHRRCPGTPGVPSREKCDKLPKDKRGKWEA